MKYSNSELQNIIKNKFEFLITEFELKIIYDQIQEWGYKLVYKGLKVGVTILFEFREAYINIIIHQLKEGEIENDVYPYKDSILLRNIGLDYIVKYKEPLRLTKPLYDKTSEYYGKDEAVEILIDILSENLRKFASNTLRGDFTLFKEIDSFVKEHYKV